MSDPTAILLIGIPATGKSTFCRLRFFDSHLRLNLDQLRTRHREKLLLEVCLSSRLPFVVDNTNATRAERGSLHWSVKNRGFPGDWVLL